MMMHGDDEVTHLGPDLIIDIIPLLQNLGDVVLQYGNIEDRLLQFHTTTNTQGLLKKKPELVK